MPSEIMLQPILFPSQSFKARFSVNSQGVMPFFNSCLEPQGLQASNLNSGHPEICNILDRDLELLPRPGACERI